MEDDQDGERAASLDSGHSGGPNLYQRICSVMADVEKIDKTGKNVHFGFNFIEQSMVMAALRPKMARAGLVLIPSVEDVGTTGKNVMVTMTFTLFNADDPTDRLSFRWCAEGQDSTDKGIVKAIVQAQKYALMKLFMLSDKDDPDADGPLPDERAATPAAVIDGQRTRPQHQQRAPAPAPAPAPRAAAPREPTLVTTARAMAAETQDEGALDGTSAPTPVASARKSAWEALKAHCQAIGLEQPKQLRQVNALAEQYDLPRVEDLADVTTAWLDDVRRALPRARQAADAHRARQPATLTREQALAGWIAAAADGATLEQLATDVARAHEAGTVTDKTAEALLEAVDARSAELDLYPQSADQAGAQEAAATAAVADREAHRREVDAVRGG